ALARLFCAHAPIPAALPAEAPKGRRHARPAFHSPTVPMPARRGDRAAVRLLDPGPGLRAHGAVLGVCRQRVGAVRAAPARHRGELGVGRAAPRRWPLDLPRLSRLLRGRLLPGPAVSHRPAPGMTAPRLRSTW